MRKLKLRQIEKQDLPQLRDWRNSDTIRNRCREYRLLNMINQEEWFVRISTSRDIEMFGIELDGNLIGVCGLCYIDWVNRAAEISLYFGSEELQESFGSEALELLEIKAFEEFNLHRLWIEMSAFMHPVFNMIETIGYSREGVLKGHVFSNGQYWDSYIYGKTR